MQYFLTCRVSKMVYCKIHYLQIKSHKILFKFIQNFSFSTTPSFKGLARIYDHNFNFFHQNPEYKLSCMQIQPKQLQKSSIMIQNLNCQLDRLSNKLYINDLLHDQVVEMMEWIVNVKVGTNSNKFFPLKFIDEKCTSMVPDWSLNTSLYVFDAWFLILQHKAFQVQYFGSVLDLWFENCNMWTKNNTIQITYYLGLYEKFPDRIIRKLVKKINEKQAEMSDIEIAIVCLSCFRLRVKTMSSPVITRVINAAQNFITQSEKFHLISTLKFLRQLQIHDGELNGLLQQYILKEYGSFNFVHCVNFLATFSTQSIYNKSLFQVLEKQSSAILESEKCSDTAVSNRDVTKHPTVRSRVKDLSRYLWAMVNVGHELNRTTVETVLSMTRKRYSTREYKDQFHCLVDCLHSLVIINVYPEDLLRIVFKRKNLSRLQLGARMKPLHQMYFLHKSIEIEKPELFKSIVEEGLLHSLKPLPKDLGKQIQERKDLADLLSLCRRLDIPGLQVEFCSVLPHILILGIKIKRSVVKDNLIDKGEEIYVEVLDTHTCCHDSATPLGLMATKLRQLKKLYCNVVTITQQDISLIKAISPPEQKIQLRKLLFL